MKLDYDLSKLTIEAERDHPNAFRAEVYISDGFYPHFHRNPEIYLVYDGTVTVTINNVEYVLHGGQAMCINSYDIHSYKIDGLARVGFVNIGLNYTNNFNSLYPRRSLPTELLDVDKNKPLFDFIEQIKGTIAENSDRRRLLYYTYVNYILYLIVDTYGTSTTKAQTKHSTRNIVQYIYENAEKKSDVKLYRQGIWLLTRFAQPLFQSLHTYRFPHVSERHPHAKSVGTARQSRLRRPIDSRSCHPVRFQFGIQLLPRMSPLRQ